VHLAALCCVLKAAVRKPLTASLVKSTGPESKICPAQHDRISLLRACASAEVPGVASI
jgi:hypothetical protein